MSGLSLLLLQPAVTWIKVEKPTFDLVGVVLGSFRLAGFLLVLAVLLGLALGVALVRARRRASASPLDAVSLHLSFLGGVAPHPPDPPLAMRE
jgi:ABC-type spermidine/putrescine transport system permease subunit II